MKVNVPCYWSGVWRNADTVRFVFKDECLGIMPTSS